MPISSSKATLTIEYDGTEIAAKIGKKTAPHLLGGLLFILSKPAAIQAILAASQQSLSQEDLKIVVNTYFQCVNFDDLQKENTEDWKRPMVPNNAVTESEMDEEIDGE